MIPDRIVSFPFAAGLLTKGNKQAKGPPALDICKDVEFDDVGGLRTRYPFASLGVNIFGGGTLSNIRRIVENGNELLCFTKDTLYSWNAQLSKWVSKGTHLAVKVGEAPVFVTTGEQVDADRAELNGTIVYTWTETVGASVLGYVAAVDKTTGSVLMTPTRIVGTASRLRVTALTTRILLTFWDGLAPGGLYAYALDPAAPAAALAGASTTVTNVNYGTYYDIVKVPGADAAAFVARQNPTTSYTVGTITAGLAVTKTTKARICSGLIACSVDPTGTYIQVVRANGTSTNIEGDLINAGTLADVYTAQNIAAGRSGASSITCAHRSVQNSGTYRCYVFYRNSFAAAGVIRSNWVSTTNTLGTESDFLFGKVGLGSRAFDNDGSVYVHVAFDGISAYTGAALQNSYFLYRDDGFLAAKLLTARAGGVPSTANQLPGVVSTGAGVYSWCGVERRRIPLGNTYDGYADRGPTDLTVTFDSNEARRTARLGNTLYIACGEGMLQYDGVRLAEVGFHYYPFLFTATDSGAGAGLANGSYAYKVTYRWENAQGDSERSTTASIETMTVAGGPHNVSVQDISTLTITHKTSNPPAVELWRTAVNPTDDAPYYLATDPDPTNASTTNGYIANDTTASTLFHGVSYTDAFSDTALTDNESNPENGAVLENLAPPPATLVAASDTRLFISGIAGEPDRVRYSKLRADGEVAAFHDALTVAIPAKGGSITALAIAKDGTPVVFRETAVYVLLADGFDNTGNGQNYTARDASADTGAVSQESVVVTDRGIIFKSSRGWCVLNEAFQVEYIGAPVAAYDSEDALAAHVIPTQHQVRILTSSRMLVWDYLVNQWGEWTIASGVDACIWNDTHVYATASSVKQQQTTYSGVDYGFDIETTWIKISDLQGRGLVRAIETLGEYRGAHSLRVRLARNYQSDGAGGWSYFQDKTWTVTPTVVGGPEQLKHAPSIKRPYQAIKVRLTAGAVGGGLPTGETCNLTGICIAVADEGALYSGLAAGQKQ